MNVKIPNGIQQIPQFLPYEYIYNGFFFQFERCLDSTHSLRIQFKMEAKVTGKLTMKNENPKKLKNSNGSDKSFEQKMWDAADKLRKNIDAAEYKHVVLGLIFLKYISIAFEELYQKLNSEKAKKNYADPEAKDEYDRKKIFYVPATARWSYLVSRAKLPEIGKDIDSAMDAVEKDNPSLRGVLPKVYASGNIDPVSLGKLIDEFSNINMGVTQARSAGVQGDIFEYFLGEFALAEGKKGDQFYTPRSVVQLLVEMLEPYKGRVFDPCCGSGGMFVQSEDFVKAHQGKTNDISIYGQESNQNTWRLAKMNLAIRKIDSSQVKWNNEGSFLNDVHKDLKADYIIANPPFNDSEWSGDLLHTDGRWKYGTPPAGNANYAWIQHFLYHLAPTGHAGFVMAKGALTSKSLGEGDIRKALVEARLVDCIVNLPAKLFRNPQISASVWFLRRGKTHRREQILFIDARNLGALINRSTKVFAAEDIQKITQIYHNWKNEKSNYEDSKGFSKSASIEDVAKLDYLLTPGRYVGLEDVDDGFDFKERFTKLQAELEAQMKEEGVLNKRILENLARVQYDK